MLASGKKIIATTDNAIMLINTVTKYLRKPKYSFDLLQVKFCLDEFSRFSFFSIYLNDLPTLDVKRHLFVLTWSSKNRWEIMTQEDFDYLFS